MKRCIRARIGSSPSAFGWNGQASACVEVLNLGWFPEEEKDTAEYLTRPITSSRPYGFSRDLLNVFQHTDTHSYSIGCNPFARTA